uniref:Uncharacterized protein n=1 Tax=Anguilla anguilla TaxID=7936 RepID=A0A0E9Q2M2_ANGAN
MLAGFSPLSHVKRQKTYGFKMRSHLCFLFNGATAKFCQIKTQALYCQLQCK